MWDQLGFICPTPTPTCPNYDGTMTVQLLHVQNDMISVQGIQDQMCSSFDFAGTDGSLLIVCAEWCIQRSGHAGAVRHAGTVALYASSRQHQLWLSTTATPGSLTAPSPSPRGFTSTVWLVHSVCACEWKRENVCVCVWVCARTRMHGYACVCVCEREKREHVCVFAHLCQYVCECVSHPVWFVHCVCRSVSV